MPVAATACATTSLIVVAVAQAVFAGPVRLARGCKLGERSLDLMASGRRCRCLRRGGTVCTRHDLYCPGKSNPPGIYKARAPKIGIMRSRLPSCVVSRYLIAPCIGKGLFRGWKGYGSARRKLHAPVAQLPRNPSDHRPRLSTLVPFRHLKSSHAKAARLVSAHAQS